MCNLTKDINLQIRIESINKLIVLKLMKFKEMPPKYQPKANFNLLINELPTEYQKLS